MTARTPTLAQVLREYIERRLLDVHTSMPGRVESYDASKQTADVRPLLRTSYLGEDGEPVEASLPVLVNVPVKWPAGGGFRLAFVLSPGDPVAIFFAEGSLDAWQAVGGEQSGAGRRFHVADAFCSPGLHSDAQALVGVDVPTIGHSSGPGIVFTASGVQLGARSGSPATEAAILGDSYVAAEDQALTGAIAKLGAMAAAVTAASVSLGTAAGLNAVPLIGGSLAAGPLGVVVSQLAVVASKLGEVVADLSTFKAALAISVRSGKVKIG